MRTFRRRPEIDGEAVRDVNRRGLGQPDDEDAVGLLEGNCAVAEQPDAGHCLMVRKATNHGPSVVGQASWNA